MSKIRLGVIAEDKVTGFRGTVTSKVKYLTGCDQYCLKPKVDKDGNIVDGCYFDGGQLEYISEGISKKDVQTDVKGGPNMDAPKG